MTEMEAQIARLREECERLASATDAWRINALRVIIDVSSKLTEGALQQLNDLQPDQPQPEPDPQDGDPE
jgi:hypothetical protein